MRLVSFIDPTGAAGVGRLDGEAVAVLRAPTMLDWLRGDGHEATGTHHALAGVTLRAPVPPAWCAAPAFYFANPASIHGPGEAARRPDTTRELDFELEIAAIVGADGSIAGYTLLNDLSARDIQREEVTVGLGPSKGKDFATALGPWLVTPDELPIHDGRLQLEATVAVNGVELTRCDAAAQHFSWPQIAAHAARDTRLRPGDVLGSGTLERGCLLELGPVVDGHRWLEPGDSVTLSAPGLGALTTPVI